MRIFRYIVFGVFARSGVVLLLLALIYVAIDFVEIRGIAGSMPVSFFDGYIFRLPMIVSHILPISLALGVQIILSSMRSHGEWEALLGTGLGPRVLGLYLLAVPAGMIPVQYGLESVVVPKAMSAWRESALENGANHVEYLQNRAAAWCEKGPFLVHEGAPGEPRIVISRGEFGAPTLWKRIGASLGHVDSMEWRPGQGWVKGVPALAIGDLHCHREGDALAMSFKGGFPGDSLTNGELDSARERARSSGHSPTPFVTERSVRIALCLACLAVPFLGLGITLNRDESRMGRLIAAGLFAAALFWLMLAIAWNGALAELWSPLSVSVGVPLLAFSFGVLLLGKKG